MAHDQLPGPHLLEDERTLLEPVFLGGMMVVLGNAAVELRRRLFRHDVTLLRPNNSAPKNRSRDSAFVPSSKLDFQNQC